MSADLVLFGPPGAGKGTQAKRLEADVGLPQIATGDMMRRERASGSDLGKQFEQYMSAGMLVPDELVLSLLRKRLSESDAERGAIFDGYPRTLDQARSLDQVLGDMNRSVQRVVVLEVPVEQLIDRITGRRVCLACGQTYHLRYNPPPQTGCGACGGTELTQRKDDTEEVVRTRYSEYKGKTEPILEHYRPHGVVVSVDGTGDLDQVTERIKEAVAPVVAEA